MKMSEDLEKMKPSIKRVGPLKLPVILPKGSSRGSTGNPDEERPEYFVRKFRINPSGDVTFLDKYGKAIATVPGRELPPEIRWLYYDILRAEKE